MTDTVCGWPNCTCSIPTRCRSESGSDSAKTAVADEPTEVVFAEVPASLNAIACIDLVDRLLEEGGYAEDSSARHHLAIGRSFISTAPNWQPGTIDILDIARECGADFDDACSDGSRVVVHLLSEQLADFAERIRQLSVARKQADKCPKCGTTQWWAPGTSRVEPGEVFNRCCRCGNEWVGGTSNGC